MGRTRTVALLALAAVALAGFSVPARAQEPGPAGTVLLSLAQRTGDAARLRQLARQSLAPAVPGQAARSAVADRRTALDALAPDASHVAAVRAFARAQGLQVQRSDRWTATLSGPAAQLASIFGTSLSGGRASTPLLVPGPLAAHVSVVSGLDDRPLLRPHAVPYGQTGPSLRLRYDAPDGWTGAGVTVGTLNLTGWDPDDLSTYAAAAGITLAPGQITTVPVGNPADPLVPDGSGDDLEVAMDAQAILAVAPAARQRQYFAPNNGVGTIDAFNQMASDGQAGLLQVASTSWGLCETLLQPYPWYVEQVGQAVDRMLAAGVTLFAAAGDAGIYDCSRQGDVDNRKAVDFPASYPGVVSVGGTRLGTTETVWGQPGLTAADPGTTFAGLGGGGGVSALFSRPAHQSGLAVAGSSRLVPDVASVADPSTGLGVYNARAGGWVLGGGTSLGAPTWAGLTAAALSAAGRTTGLGNILPTLYAHPEAFRDIVSGSNGYAAGSGFDLASGLGAPVWGALGPLLTGQLPDTVAPRAAASAALVSPTSNRALLRWSGTDPAPSAGLTAYDVKLVLKGGGTVWSATTTARSTRRTLVPGRTYTLYARSRDFAGNLSPWAASRLHVPYDQGSLWRTGSWSSVAHASDYRGTHFASARRGSTATLRVTGTSATLGVVRTARSGYLDVWVDGKRVRRLDLYSARTIFRQQVRLASWTRSGTHTIKLVVVGKRRSASTSNTVRIDSLTVRR